MKFTAREIRRMVALRQKIDAGLVSDETQASKRLLFARYLVAGSRIREWINAVDDDGTYEMHKYN